MKRFTMFFATLMLCICISHSAHSREELAPGYDKCVEKSDYVFQELMICIGDAEGYWGDMARKKMAEMAEQCVKSGNADLCLRHMEKILQYWRSYSYELASMIPEFSREHAGREGQLSGAYSEAEASKGFAKMLGGDR